MQISSRFTIALHILTAMDYFGKDCKVTSDFLAGSIGTNPVIIRRLLTQLKNSGLIHVARGTGGCEPARALNEITFYDVYMAVDAVEDEKLFHMHEHPNPECPVGRNINVLLEDKLLDIQVAMENEMKRHTVAELHDGIMELIAEES